MNKKLTAILTALLCLTTNAAGLNVSAEDSERLTMVVVGVDDAENPQNYIMMRKPSRYDLSATFYLPDYMVEQYIKEGTIAYGDILSIHKSFCNETMDGTNYCYLMDEDADIQVVGSVFDEGTAETYTVEWVTETNWKLVDENGGTYRNYHDFLKKYIQPDGFDSQKCKSGDIVTMISYDGWAYLPVNISPLGDTNSDGDLDILDVILLNKAVLIGEPIPALETDTGTAKLARSGETDYGQCDFNGNGTLDLDDSLGMMKRILGIEETE